MAGKQPDEDVSEEEPDADVLRAFRFDTLLEVFSPSAPVDREEIFAGRADQLAALFVVSRQRGQHAVIYGERGVGKTSLARICAERARQEDFFVANVTCDSGDNSSRAENCFPGCAPAGAARRAGRAARLRPARAPGGQLISSPLFPRGEGRKRSSMTRLLLAGGGGRDPASARSSPWSRTGAQVWWGTS